MPVRAARLANVLARDVHPAVALRVQQHLLDQPATLLLGGAALVQRGAPRRAAPPGRRAAPPARPGSAAGGPPDARGGQQLEALARPGGAEEAGRLLLQPPHLVERRAACGALVRRRARIGRGDGRGEDASRQLEPSDSSPRRSACRPSRPGGPSPCSAPSTSPSPSRRPPARRWRCSRSSSPRARSPSPSPCP